MEPMTVWLKVNEQCVADGLEEARAKLETAEKEVVLDFSSVQRIDANAIKATEQFAISADQRGIKVALRGVSADVFKVLRLVNLCQRFSFVN